MGKGPVRVADAITWLRILVLPYPGVVRPPMKETGTDTSGAAMPSTAATRLTGQR